MSHTEARESTEDEESLKSVFEEAMKLYDKVENTNDAMNSEAVQMNIKAAILKFEKATNLVSLAGIFSRNESVEELPTDTLQYLLLPALLGSLTLKLCNQPRKDLIHVSEIYFRDFLQRCKDYGVTDIEVPQSDPENGERQDGARSQSEVAKITNMVLTREAKIKRYKEMKELQEKLSTLSKAMSSAIIDEETKREYFSTMLSSYVNQAIDEIASIEQEKPILEYMAKHAGEPKPKEQPRAPPLKPVIITRDAIQKAVYGMGYPSLPTMTVEEFYDKRVREGIFPSASNIPHATIQAAEGDDDETEAIEKEQLEEQDDAEHLERQRTMDEYKDEHRRGWGNRHNRS